MKKIIIWFGCILILVSCTPNDQEDEILQTNEEEADQELSIVPSYRLASDNYKIILPYRTSEARGVITNQVFNRLDIDELEEGLQHHSKEYFDPEKYYFEEGQYLKEDMVYDWLGRAPSEDELEEMVEERVRQLERDGRTVDKDQIREELQTGLNPPIEDMEALDEEERINEHRENPRYISHILEQNFLERKEDNTVELVGVSIGVALKSVYQFQTEIGGASHYKEISEREMLEEGKKAAEKILDRVREIEALQDVPIMIALYREAEQSSPVPGNFVVKTLVEEGTGIEKWEEIDENYVLFPSEESRENYFDDDQLIQNFSNDIVEYFPNYVGVVGEGFYVEDELKKLTLDIPLQFYGKSEVIGFTQYVYGLLQEMFPNHYDLEVKINSSNRMESFMYRSAGEEDLEVHIFH